MLTARVLLIKTFLAETFHFLSTLNLLSALLFIDFFFALPNDVAMIPIKWTTSNKLLL